MKWLALCLAPVALFAGQARYARLGAFEGPVEVQLTAADPWIPAERNLPLPEGAWLRTAAAARVEVELDDGSALRLAPDSQCELSDYGTLSTGQRITLLSLDHGIVYFTRPAGVRDTTSLVMPGMQVMSARAARVRLEATPQASEVSVLDGTVRFSSPAAEIDLVQGQTSRVEPDIPQRFFLDRAISPRESDEWSAARDKALATSASAGHVLEHYGLSDLDAAGKWIQTDQFGAVWKPAVAPGWAPFQKGRWLWYDALGYTWIGGDAWGWLPYHYGRWAHTADLGWLWVPSLSQVFKPGEVYWMEAKDATFVAWGPLAPGEQFNGADQPQLFANAFTTFANYTPGARTVDPTGFSMRPKEPLTVAAFTSALPSPAMPAARLDAVRPLVRAGSTRVDPVVRGVTFEITENRPEPEKVYVPVPVPVEQPAPEPEQVAVPVAVPYPVIAGVIAIPPAKSPKKPATPPSHPPGRRPRDAGETEIYNQALRDEHVPAKQLLDLDNWTSRYPDSDFKNDRTVLYMQAYDRTNQPLRVVQLGTTLLATQPLKDAFPDPQAGPVQILNVLYLTVKNAPNVPQLSERQRRLIRNAAHELLAYTPQFFAPERRPANVTEADWNQIKAQMDALAQAVLR